MAMLLAGCGKTNAAAIEELKPQFSVVRKNLAALTEHLADPSQHAPLKGLVFVEAKGELGTVTILMPDQLSDPDADPSRVVSC